MFFLLGRERNLASPRYTRYFEDSCGWQNTCPRCTLHEVSEPKCEGFTDLIYLTGLYLVNRIVQPVKLNNLTTHYVDGTR